MVPSHLHHLHLEGMVCCKCRFPGLLQTLSLVWAQEPADSAGAPLILLRT